MCGRYVTAAYIAGHRSSRRPLLLTSPGQWQLLQQPYSSQSRTLIQRRAAGSLLYSQHALQPATPPPPSTIGPASSADVNYYPGTTGLQTGAQTARGVNGGPNRKTEKTDRTGHDKPSSSDSHSPGPVVFPAPLFGPSSFSPAFPAPCGGQDSASSIVTFVLALADHYLIINDCAVYSAAGE